MSKDNEIVDDRSLPKSDVIDIVSEYAEIGIDTFIDGEITKEIPIVSSIMSVYRLGNSILDKIFVKKVLSFLHQVKDTTQSERSAWLDSIQLDSNKRQRVGESLTMLINSSNNYEQSKMIGKIYCACIKNQITYQEMLKLSTIVNRSYIPTLVKTKEFEIEGFGNLEDHLIEELLSYGVITLKLEDNKDHMGWTERSKTKAFSDRSKSETFNQRILYELTNLGKLFSEHILK